MVSSSASRLQLGLPNTVRKRCRRTFLLSSWASSVLGVVYSRVGVTSQSRRVAPAIERRRHPPTSPSRSAYRLVPYVAAHRSASPPRQKHRACDVIARPSGHGSIGHASQPRRRHLFHSVKAPSRHSVATRPRGHRPLRLGHLRRSRWDQPWPCDRIPCPAPDTISSSARSFLRLSLVNRLSVAITMAAAVVAILLCNIPSSSSTFEESSSHILPRLRPATTA